MTAWAAVLLLAQADPLEALRSELGPGFRCERVEAGVLLASDVDAEPLRACLKKSVDALRARAFEPAPVDTLVVIAFKDTEGFKAYTAKRYPEPFELPVYYDVAQRRLLVHAEIGTAFAPARVFSFQLGQHLGVPLLPSWSDAMLSALEEEPRSAESIFDSHAALLRGALRRNAVPSLREMLGMSPAVFRSTGLHAAVLRKLALYLEEQGRLKAFYAELRKVPSGVAALEAALGKPMGEVEKDVEAHLKQVPWLREERFRAFAAKGFGPGLAFRRDDDLFLAVATDVGDVATSRAIEELKRLREPLLKHLEIRASGLPLLLRLFHDDAAFQDFARFESTERGWITGYYLPIARSISVNLSAGVGALTHEVCHSIFEDELGVLPPWANEGLASLYESFRIEKGVPIAERGTTLKSLNGGPSLAAFTAMNGKAFWDEKDRATHYALARGVFLYMQDTGALAPFVRALRDARRAKPSTPIDAAACRKALETAAGRPLAAIDDAFRRWAAERR